MTHAKNIKAVLKGVAFGLFVTGIAFYATSASAEDKGGIAAPKIEALVTLISTGAISPSRIGIDEKKYTLSSEFLSTKPSPRAFAFSPESGKAPVFMLKPMFITKQGQATNNITFNSVDQFIVSLTEQDRANSSQTFANNPAFLNTQQGALPTTSRSNLLNSRFANLLAKKLTGSK
ncbi:MAG: hypothetical protein V3R64_00845 [Sphingomonadales bacterium]